MNHTGDRVAKRACPSYSQPPRPSTLCYRSEITRPACYSARPRCVCGGVWGREVHRRPAWSIASVPGYASLAPGGLSWGACLEFLPAACNKACLRPGRDLPTLSLLFPPFHLSLPGSKRVRPAACQSPSPLFLLLNLASHPGCAWVGPACCQSRVQPRLPAGRCAVPAPRREDRTHRLHSWYVKWHVSSSHHFRSIDILRVAVAAVCGGWYSPVPCAPALPRPIILTFLPPVSRRHDHPPLIPCP